MNRINNLLRIGSSKYILRNAFSTELAIVTSSLPPNLQLADLAVLQPPKPPLIKDIEYLFPTMSVPESIDVKSFQNPGAGVVSTAPLSKEIFSVAIRKDIVAHMVRYQRAKLRQPQKTKAVNEIRGSTRKLRQQKGTGKARVSLNRAPGRRGGAKAHGPVLRSFEFTLNRKMRAMALMIAVSAKQREGNLLVFDNFNCETHQTKQLTKLLEQHDLYRKVSLFVDDNFDERFLLASRNLQYVTAIYQEKANVYDIVRREKLVITVQALKNLQERVLSQRHYEGKRKAFLQGLATMTKLREIHQEKMRKQAGQE